jgi:hypothetical protein
VDNLPPFRVVESIPAPVPVPQPGRTRTRNWLTRNNIVMAVLALVLLFGAVLLFNRVGEIFVVLN